LTQGCRHWGRILRGLVNGYIVEWLNGCWAYAGVKAFRKQGRKTIQQ